MGITIDLGKLFSKLFKKKDKGENEKPKFSNWQEWAEYAVHPEVYENVKQSYEHVNIKEDLKSFGVDESELNTLYLITSLNLAGCKQLDLELLDSDVFNLSLGEAVGVVISEEKLHTLIEYYYNNFYNAEKQMEYYNWSKEHHR